MVDIIVETLDFSNADHVMIHVNVGKMPPQVANNYLDRIKKVTPLCKQLEELSIPFTLVGMRNTENHETVKAMEVSIDSNNDTIEPEDLEAYEAFNRARM